MSQPPKRLRSALWSSETLIQGMKAISKQPDRMMAPKDELESDDAWLGSGVSSFLFFEELNLQFAFV